MRKILHIFAAAIFCALSAGAVPVTPATIPHVTFVNGSGGPCAGCKLSTFTAGTTTPLATYTDSTGTSVNTNPITLDAAGGANIWLGRFSYKFILKDSLGNTIWTVDNVNAATLFPCAPAGTIQIANSGVNGLSCDANITIDTINHTLKVGTLGPNYVTIGALGTPTSWFFDTTSPATALASLGGGFSFPGAGIPKSTGTAWGTSYTTSGSGTVVALATSPVFITPTLGVASATSVQIASGTALAGNQGNGTLVQHSTGSTTSGHGAMFDASGNVVDGGSPYVNTTTDYVWTFTSCSNNVGQPSQCLGSTTLPGIMPDATYSVHCDVFTGSEPSDQFIVISTWPLPTSSGGTLSYRMVQPMQNGTTGGVAMPVVCHAHHN
jgi:hypothetical protein